MKRVPQLLLLLFECCVTLTVTLHPRHRVDKYNEGHRECNEDKGIPTSLLGLHRMKTGSKISVEISGPIKISSTTRSTPRATEEPKIAEHKPRRTESEFEFPHRLLDRSSLTHALLRKTYDKGAMTGRVGEGSRSIGTRFALKVLLPLLFSFKLQVTAMAILLVLLAIKKALILSALLIPILNNTKFNGHYIMDVKFPRTQEHLFAQERDYGRMRAQPYDRQLERKEPLQYYVIPHPSGPQVYKHKANAGVYTMTYKANPANQGI